MDRHRSRLMLKDFVLALIDGYRMSAKLRRWLLPPVCRYYPSCSTYAYQAIQRHGVIQGVRLSILRLARCHPWHAGGIDPVPSTLGLFTNQENFCEHY